MILIGFMGSGKTTVGSLLAECKERAFIDLDTFIVDDIDLTIPEIFMIYGEEGFRQIEYNALVYLHERYPNAIIATGGGVVTYEKSYELLKKTLHEIVYLEIPFEESYRRIKNDSNRPLVQEEKGDLEKIYERRLKLYESLSDRTINATKRLDEIIHELKN